MRNLLNLKLLLLIWLLSVPVNALTVIDSELKVDTIGVFGVINDIKYHDGYIYVADAGTASAASPDNVYRINLETYNIDNIDHSYDFYQYSG
ncbi:MAG: hypothetical protein ABIJ45_05230 [Candidatus Zixiibacteriota bacterium]